MLFQKDSSLRRFFVLVQILANRGSLNCGLDSVGNPREPLSVAGQVTEADGEMELFALVLPNFNLQFEKRYGPVRLTEKGVGVRQKVERERLIGGVLETRESVLAVRKQRRQQIDARLVGPQAKIEVLGEPVVS